MEGGEQVRQEVRRYSNKALKGEKGGERAQKKLRKTRKEEYWKKEIRNNQKEEEINYEINKLIDKEMRSDRKL